jgi:hypothetical protein
MGFSNWWSWSGSNRRPPECKSGALPAELQPPELRWLVDGGWCLVEKLFHQPLATNHRPRIFNRGRLDARTIQTSRTAARIHSLTPSQRCRDGLSEIPEGTPEVYGVERLSVTNRFLTVAARLRIRRLHPRSLRKEVIQPQVLLRLPCYDFTPIMSHTLGRCLPCGSACGLLVQPTFVM